MTGVSWQPGCPVALRDLRVVTASHWDFTGRVRTGRVIVHRDVATEVLSVLRLYAARFPLRRVVPVDAYGGSDFRSIEADNTSAFNCRYVDGTRRWSEHAYGRAIDVNPIENPFVSGGRTSHRASIPFVGRTPCRAGMACTGNVLVHAFAASRLGVGWRLELGQGLPALLGERPVSDDRAPMDDLRRELHAAADLIAEYREGLPDAQVTPRAGRADIRDALGGPVPPDPTPLHGDRRARSCSRPGPDGLGRPALLQVRDRWLDRRRPHCGRADGRVGSSSLQQRPCRRRCCRRRHRRPVAEELLHLPPRRQSGVRHGRSGEGTPSALPAGRWQVLNRAGWDVGRDGLFEAPRIRVVVGAGVTRPSTAASASSASASLDRGGACAPTARWTRLSCRACSSGPDRPTIVCAQAGNVNTGACDDLVAAAAAARASTRGSTSTVPSASGLRRARARVTSSRSRARRLVVV